ncbi:MAG: VOC family protein [Candidatus Gracilibacteria bacterium]
MQKIIPFFWFEKDADKAVDFYTSIFKNSKIGKSAYYNEEGAKVSGQPEGSLMTLDFELEGYQFMALNGGPGFPMSPAISFYVGFDTPEELDEVWNKLIDGGFAMMELGEYPFSKKYGWLQDKYGVTWQLYCGESKQRIVPSFLFVKEQCGRAEEAMNFYTSLFENSEIRVTARYPEGGADKAGTIMHGAFTLAGQHFTAMDSALDHKFTFPSAISFMVNCDTQEEIDHFWDAFSKEGKTEQCGWLKDKFGVSWQIVPSNQEEISNSDDKAANDRVIHAMFDMVKLDKAKLEAAFRGE